MTSIKTITTLVTISLLFSLHPSLNRGDTPITEFQHFVYGNALNIKTNNQVDRHLLEINWVCDDGNSPFKDLTIFKNGWQINEIPSVKGSQKLIVFYDGKKMGEIPQHKSASNQSHDYNINFSSDSKTLFFKGEIIGPSPHHGKPVTMASI